MKFLVLWEIEKLSAQTVRAVLAMPDYAGRIREQGKLVERYHVVGRHGGAWIYDVDSNEELERLLAAAPVYNYSRYEVLPLAEMTGPERVMSPAGPADGA